MWRTIRTWHLFIALVVVYLSQTAAAMVLAQQPQTGTAALDQQQNAMPPTGAPAAPGSGTDSNAALRAEIQRLKASQQQLQQQLDAVLRRYQLNDSLANQGVVPASFAAPSASTATPSDFGIVPGRDPDSRPPLFSNASQPGTSDSATWMTAMQVAPPASGTRNAPPATANPPPTPPDEYQIEAPSPEEAAAAAAGGLPSYTVDFKDGVLFRTNDGMFSLRINNLTQMDARVFSHTADGAHTATSLQDNFVVPREWFFFRGNVTEYVDYQVLVASGVAASSTTASSFNLFDAFLDFNPFGQEQKEKFQIRVGRFRTPFMYQFFNLVPQDYIAPELSMFATNFIQNRQIGVMPHGKLFDGRLEYAGGVFNGQPNSYEVTFSNRTGMALLGYTPFLLQRGSVLQYLTFVGSYVNGRQFGSPVPSFLGTAVPSAGPSDNALISPTFLMFGSDTVQDGPRVLWDAEVLWSFRSLSFYGEYDAGYVTYGLSTSPGTTAAPVSVSGWSAALTYFFSGEEIGLDRRRVQPLHPYNWKKGGFGAFEGFARYSDLVLGSSVFTDKFASATGNANGVNATDIGVNWYLNQYLKVVLDWQHAMFNRPIELSTTRFTRLEDLYWLRFQLYY